jgi:hypothetical protein
MRNRSAELILITAVCCLGQAAEAQEARLLSQFVWQGSAESHGGYSGIELSDDGQAFTIINDKGIIVQGRFERAASQAGTGEITGISETFRKRLQSDTGAPLVPEGRDTEGLAIARDGRVFVSVEGVHLVLAFASAGANAVVLPQPDQFLSFGSNSSLEALAIDDQGTLFTLPERSGRLRRPFPVFTYRDGAWSQPFAVPRRGAFLVVGADFGPDGRLYILEREVRSPFGLASRVRSFDVSADHAGDERLHLETAPGVHQNLEGISVWRDGDGALRLTMIADNNFIRFVRTFIVEYALEQ